MLSSRTTATATTTTTGTEAVVRKARGDRRDALGYAGAGFVTGVAMTLPIGEAERETTRAWDEGTRRSRGFSLSFVPIATQLFRLLPPLFMFLSGTTRRGVPEICPHRRLGSCILPASIQRVPRERGKATR